MFFLISLQGINIDINIKIRNIKPNIGQLCRFWYHSPKFIHSFWSQISRQIQFL